MSHWFWSNWSNWSNWNNWSNWTNTYIQPSWSADQNVDDHDDHDPTVSASYYYYQRGSDLDYFTKLEFSVSNSDSGDELFLDLSDTSLTISGNTIYSGSTAIATVSGGSDGATLVITPLITGSTQQSFGNDLAALVDSVRYQNDGGVQDASKVLYFRSTDDDGSVRSWSTTLNIEVGASQPSFNDSTIDVEQTPESGQDLGHQTHGRPHIAATDDGGYLVSRSGYDSATGTYEIYVHRYDSEGQSVGQPVMVSASGANSAYYPSVTATSDGGYVAVWGEQNGDSSSWAVYAHRYDADGNSVGGIIQVNTFTNGDQNYPQVIELAGGDVVVAWMDASQDGSGWGLYGQILDSDGNTSGGEFQITQTTYSAQQFAKLAALPDGGFAATWMDLQADGNGWGVLGRIFEADGSARTNEFQVNEYTNSTQYAPTITTLADGNVVISWMTYKDGDRYDVAARIYDADGNAVTGEFEVAATVNEEYYPNVVANPDGTFTVIWREYDISTSELSIEGRIFNADGTASGFSFPIKGNAYTDTFNVAAAGLSDGSVAIVFFNQTDGHQTGVFDFTQIEFVSEYGDSLPIVLDVDWQDQDGSEAVQIVVTGFPEGTTFNLGSLAPDGSWVIDITDPSELDGLEMTGPDGYFGTFDLTFTATTTEDLNGDTSTAVSTFATTINAPPNFAPEVDTPILDQNVNEDAAWSFTVPQDTFSDAEGDTLTLTASLANGDPLPAWLSFDGTTFSGTPPLDFNGNIELAVTAADEFQSVTDTFTLTIDPVNDAPVVASAIADANSDEDAAWSFPVPAGTFSDVDGDALTLTASLAGGDTLPAWLTFDGTTFSGTPPQDWNGSLDIAVTASDGDLSVKGSFTLTIDPVNDAPVATPIDAGSSNEDAGSFGIDLLANASDVDGDDLDVANVSAASSNAGRAVAFTHDGETGAFSLDPSQFNDLAVGESETVTVTYDVVDGNGGVTATTATFVVEGRNDAPVATLIYVPGTNEDAPSFAVDLLLTASDVDNSDDLDVAGVGVTSESDRTVLYSVDTETGILSLDPRQFNDLAAGEIEWITVTYQINDGNGGVTPNTATFIVVGRNDGPLLSVGTPPPGGTTNEDAGFFTDNLLDHAVDPDGDDLDIQNLTVSSSNASRTVEHQVDLETGDLSFDLDQFGDLSEGESEVVTISFVIVDEHGATTNYSYTLQVDGRNDAPVLVNPLLDQSSDEDEAFFFSVPADTFEDPGGDTLTLSATLANGDPLPAWLTFDGTTFSGTPPQDFNGDFDVEVTATDGEFDVSDVFTLTIDPVNDAPVVASAIADANSDEDAAWSFPVPAGTFSDVDGDALTLTASLAGGDTLPAWLTFDGTTFSGTPPQDWNGSLDIAVTASDGDLSVNGSFTLTIDPVNDAPVATPIDAGSSNEDAGSFGIDLLANASDVDTSDDLDVANVSVGSSNAGRTVAFTHDGETGAFSLDPSQFNDLAVGESETVTVTYDVVDGNGGVTATTATFVVEGRNDAPVVTPITGATTDEDAAPYALDLLANASDVDTSDDLDVANVSVGSSNAGRTVAFTHDGETGAFSLDPSQFNDLAVGESETVTVTYDVVDGNGGVTATTATFVVEGRNDAPVVTPITGATTDEDAAPYALDLLANASDVDTSDDLDVANVSVGSSNAGRTVAFTHDGETGAFSLDPSQFNDLAVGESETVTVTYDVVDGNGGVTATTATFVVEGRNDAPVVTPITGATTDEDAAPYALDLLANASDVDTSDDLDVANVSVGSSNAGRTVAFTHDGETGAFSLDPSQFNDLAVGESETVTVTYDVVDGNGGVTATTATFVVEGRNDAPVVTPITGATTDEDAAPYALDLLANASDVDTSDDLDVANVSVGSSNAGRTVAFTHDGETGAFSLDPSQFNDLAVGESETVTVTYDVVDGNGGVTATTATFVVEGRNDAPVVTPITGATTDEDAAPYALDLLANASDVDTSDDLDVANVSVGSSNAGRTVAFTHDGETGAFSLDPSQFNDLAVGESETVTVTYDVVDGNGGVTATTATFVVEGRNDAPVVTPITGATTDEDAAPYALDLLANASDVDTSDDLDVANVSVGSSNAGRTVAFTHDGETGAFSLDPSQFNDLAVGESETVTVTYDVVDGNGGVTATTATFVVEGRNDAPVVTPITGATTDEDAAPYALDLLANASDVDTSDDLDVANVSVGSSNAGRTVAFTHDGETGAFSLDPSQFNDLAVGESETVTVTYDVVDGNGGVTATTATFVVEGRNDAPVVTPITGATTDEDAAPYALDLLANASDVDTSDDLDVANVSVGSSNAGRTVAFTHDGETGAFSLDPSQFNDLAVGESETVTVTYDVVDGNGGVTATTATFVVEGRNDAPVVVDQSATAIEDLSTSGNLLDGASDPDDSDVLTVAAVAFGAATAAAGTAIQGQWGTLLVQADGSYTYFADADALDELSGVTGLTDSFDFTVSDGNGGTDTKTLTVDVNLADDERTTNGGNGSNTLVGDQDSVGAEDTMFGGNGRDTLEGLDGADNLWGGRGDDAIFGGQGRDEMFGENGDDILNGGIGNDYLEGGRGDDLLTGGAGNDVFAFGKSNGNDTITDFEQGDSILLLDNVKVKKQTVKDVDGDGIDDLVIQLSNGSVTLLGVGEALTETDDGWVLI